MTTKTQSEILDMVIAEMKTNHSMTDAMEDLLRDELTNGKARRFSGMLSSLDGEEEADVITEMPSLIAAAQQAIAAAAPPSRTSRKIFSVKRVVKTLVALALVALIGGGGYYGYKAYTSTPMQAAAASDTTATPDTVLKTEFDSKMAEMTAKVDELTAANLALKTTADANVAEVEKHPHFIILKAQLDTANETVKRAIEIDNLRKEMVQVLAVMASTRDQKVYDENFPKFKAIDDKLAAYAPAASSTPKN